MKATVNQLWDTYREIITFDNSEFERPTSINDLKKCENVIVGAKIFKGGPTEVMIDDSIYLVTPVKLQHPSGGGSMIVLEIY
jgi:hypothetical protein